MKEGEKEKSENKSNRKAALKKGRESNERRQKLSSSITRKFLCVIHQESS